MPPTTSPRQPLEDSRSHIGAANHVPKAFHLELIALSCGSDKPVEVVLDRLSPYFSVGKPFPPAPQFGQLENGEPELQVASNMSGTPVLRAAAGDLGVSVCLQNEYRLEQNRLEQEERRLSILCEFACLVTWRLQ